jgi:hypothetical protein
MKQRSLLLLCALCLFVVGCGVRGSGSAATESRAASGFTEVEVQGIIELRLTLGAKPSIELSGDDNILPLIETKVVGKKLIISSKESISPSLPLLARVGAIDIARVTVNGASRATVEGIDNDSFTFDINGSSNATAKGQTKSFAAEVNGASSINAEALAMDKATIDINGAGHIDVSSPAELDVSISGAAKVTYAGDAKITKHISGAGVLAKR